MSCHIHGVEETHFVLIGAGLRELADGMVRCHVGPCLFLPCHFFSDHPSLAIQLRLEEGSAKRKSRAFLNWLDPVSTAPVRLTIRITTSKLKYTTSFSRMKKLFNSLLTAIS